MSTITRTQQPVNAKDLIRSMWEINSTTTVLFFASIAALLIAFAGMAIDTRIVLGQSTWTKTAKFSMSFIIYAPTLLWTYSYMTRWPRIRSFILHSTSSILLLELVLLLTQAARGVPMHFNVSTPFNATLWIIMSVTIIIFYIMSIIGAFFFVRQKIADPAFAWGLRLGLVLMLIGFGLGFLMTGTSPEQAAMQQAGETPMMIGAHTVGAPDGGRGITFLGWSTEHGDLRVAHFIGIHGAQVLALIGWAIATRLTWLSVRRRVLLVWTAALSYAGLIALVTWQALRGQSVVQPDALTLSAAAILVALTVFASAAILFVRRESMTLRAQTS